MEIGLETFTGIADLCNCFHAANSGDTRSSPQILLPARRVLAKMAIAFIEVAIDYGLEVSATLW